jgi:uncharacterized membrane protein (DUF106 family)
MSIIYMIIIIIFNYLYSKLHLHYFYISENVLFESARN